MSERGLLGITYRRSSAAAAGLLEYFEDVSRGPWKKNGALHSVIRVVIRKKETRPEAADYGRSNPRNQRRIDFLRSTTETPCPMEKHRPFAAPATRQKDVR